MTPDAAATAAIPAPRPARGMAGLIGLLIVLGFASSASLADDGVPELRLAQSFGGHFDAVSVSAAWFGRAPAWTRANRVEYSAGVIGGADSSRLFAFVGPVWQLSDRRRKHYAEFSFGSTLFDGSRINGREVGGTFHFRSALALGMRFGRRDSVRVALRFSHISNGGLREPNPGVDFIGLSIATGSLPIHTVFPTRL